MRTKLYTFAAIAFSSGLVNNSFAQEKFATYESPYTGKDYQISIHVDPKKPGEFKLYIDAFSLDQLHETGGIGVDEKEHADFIVALNTAKQKYSEWVATAQSNNVTDVRKDMDIKCKTSGYFLYGKEWEFQFRVRPTFAFKILKDPKDDVKYLLLVNTGQLVSSSNQFMKVDGFALVFSSAEEIEAFINTVSAEKIREYSNKPKTADLFKN